MAARPSSAQLALVGGRIRTLDPERPWATALASRDGIVVAVGDDAEIRELCDASTEVVDLRGGVAVPGLTDSHQHPFLGTADTLGADLTGLRTLDGVLDALRRERAAGAGDGWVRGYALKYEAFAESGIDGRLLEEAVGGAPTVLKFMDFHTSLARRPRWRWPASTGRARSSRPRRSSAATAGPTGELREAGGDGAGRRRRAGAAAPRSCWRATRRRSRACTPSASRACT